MQFAAKKWAQRTRALAKQGKTWDPAAMTAATEVFPAEFNVLILVLPRLAFMSWPFLNRSGTLICDEELPRRKSCRKITDGISGITE